MTSIRHKCYFMLAFLMSVSFCMLSQTISSKATVTIIGDPLDNSANADITEDTPPDKNQQFTAPQQIEPTFENGFHIRYDIFFSEQKTDAPDTEKMEYNGGSRSSKKIKRKHVVTLAEMQFNLKKRMKTWLPQRKKKYRPHVCGRF